MLTTIYIVEFVITKFNKKEMTDKTILPMLVLADTSNIVVGILIATQIIS